MGSWGWRAGLRRSWLARSLCRRQSPPGSTWRHRLPPHGSRSPQPPWQIGTRTRGNGGAVLVEDPALGDDIERASVPLPIASTWTMFIVSSISSRSVRHLRWRTMSDPRSSGAGHWGRYRRAKSRNPASSSGSLPQRSRASSSRHGMHPAAGEHRTASSCPNGEEVIHSTYLKGRRSPNCHLLNDLKPSKTAKAVMVVKVVKTGRSGRRIFTAGLHMQTRCKLNLPVSARRRPCRPVR